MVLALKRHCSRQSNPYIPIWVYRDEWLYFYLSISAHPVRRRISVWGCGAVTLGVWLLSVVLAAPPSLYTRYLDLRPSGIDLVVCEEFWPSSGNLRLLYSCFILLASYMVPLLSVSISYCAITVSLKRYSVPGEPSNSQQRWNQKRKRTFSLLVASVLAFALCWLPLQVRPPKWPKTNTTEFV